MKKLALVVALLTMLTWQQVAKAEDSRTFEIVIIEVPKTETRWYPYPQEFKEFPSVEFLKAWYKRNEPPVVLYADKKGRVNLVNPPRYDPRWDCDDYALWLQERALSQGWLMSVELVEGNSHMLNSVIIGNEIFLVEPQPLGHKIWKLSERD